MKLTNRNNLPHSLVAAVSYSDRNREGCDYTITELISPPRQAALKRQHWDALEEDVSDRLWALLGSAGHEVLRRSGKATGRGIIEERAIAEVAFAGKVFRIGGQIDLAVSDEGVMTDFKFTSVWAVKEGAKEEWEQQLNCYRWLAHQYGVPITKIQIVALLRDWSKPEAGRDPSYPQAGVVVFDIPLWDDATTRDWICLRIGKHESAKVQLPECSPDEVWERPAKWAVQKRGAKRATKLHDSEKSAVLHAQSSPDLEVQFRPGQRPRCESYCVCAPFCDQYTAWLAKNQPTAVKTGLL